MALEDVLPITGIVFIILGFLLILAGVICLANISSKSKATTDFPETEDIIGEINQMFTYFTDQIQQKNQSSLLVESPKVDTNPIQNQYYNDVIKYKQQGQTPEQIAKKLNIGKGEVNLILGIAQMR